LGRNCIRYCIHVNNNPINFNDPSGHWVETALDIAFIAYDIYDIKTNGLNWISGLSLAADIVGAVLPVVTGAGLAVRAIAHADDVIDAVRIVDKASNTAKSVYHVQDLAQIASRSEDLIKSQDVVGGVYRLIDAETGVTMKTGRTNDLARRAGEHFRNPDLSTFDFEQVWKTNSYNEQRGLEQILHDLYTPPLDKINPISTRNPKITIYKDAARKFLQELR